MGDFMELTEKEKEIEAEVQARVNFKMDELVTGMINRISNHHQLSFITMMQNNPQESNRQTLYKEAFSEFLDMVKKEKMMGCPNNDMAKRNRIKAKNLAVNKITRIISYHIRRDFRIIIGIPVYDRFEDAIVPIIEELQNFQNNTNEHKRAAAKNLAVDKIMEVVGSHDKQDYRILPGTRSYNSFIKALVPIIEDAQNF